MATHFDDLDDILKQNNDHIYPLKSGEYTNNPLILF